MPRKFKRYLVGYDQDRDAVYGKPEGIESRYVDPMTLLQARRELKQLTSPATKCIYKLVRVRSGAKEN